MPMGGMYDNNLELGKSYKVRIINILNYDLEGEIIKWIYQIK